MAANSMIGSLAVNLTMETAAFQKGATIAEKRANVLKQRLGGIASNLKGLGASLGIGLGLGVLTGLAAEAFELGSNLTEAAAKVGVTVEALQELRHVAEQNGVPIDTMERSLNKMTKTLGELQLGAPAITETFKQLGLTASALKGLDPSASFIKIVEALKNVKDETIRAALGNQIFGRSYAELKPIVDAGAAAILKEVEAKRASGVVSAEDAKKLDELADSWARAKASVLVFTAELLANTVKEAQAISSFVTNTKAMIEGWVTFVSTSFANVWNGAKAAFTSFRDTAVAAVQAIYNGIKTWLVDKFNAVVVSITGKIQAIGDKFKWLYDVVVGKSYVPDMVAEIGEHMDRLKNEMADPAVDATTKTAEGFASMAQSVVGSIGSVIGAIKGGGFLNILQSVVGLGLQLAGAGVFGKKIQANANKTAGYARGTNFAPGGLALVGERGPELVNLPRGSRVTPNNKMGGSVTFDLRGAVMTEDILRQINQMGEVATIAGSQRAIQMMGKAKRRALA